MVRRAARPFLAKKGPAAGTSRQSEHQKHAPLQLSTWQQCHFSPQEQRNGRFLWCFSCGMLGATRRDREKHPVVSLLTSLPWGQNSSTTALHGTAWLGFHRHGRAEELQQRP